MFDVSCEISLNVTGVRRITVGFEVERQGCGLRVLSLEVRVGDGFKPGPGRG